MTTSIDRPARAPLPEQDEGESSQIRRLRIAVIGLAVLALILGIALVVTAAGNDDVDDAAVDGANDDAVVDAAVSAPADVIQVVNDFERAFEEQDDELILSLITEDFSATADLYNADTVTPAFTAGLTPGLLSFEVRAQAWNVERSGDLLVAGDGPWVVAARETWTDTFNRDEGVRLYVIVEEDGAPKLAGYYFVVVGYSVVPDFGN